jgi:hypothetical protein
MTRWLTITAATLMTLTLASVPARAAPYDDVALVQNWYQTFLHRTPDPVGLGMWVQQLRYGTPPAVAQAGILASPEFYQLHGSTPEGFVAGLYGDILGRSAGSGEIYNWVDRLYRTGSREQTALEFLTAAQVELGQRSGAPITVPAYDPAPVYVAPPVVGRVSVYRPAWGYDRFGGYGRGWYGRDRYRGYR